MLSKEVNVSGIISVSAAVPNHRYLRLMISETVLEMLPCRSSA